MAFLEFGASNKLQQRVYFNTAIWYYFDRMQINNKITIIEGPTPEFEPVDQEEGFQIPHPWVLGVLEGPNYYHTAFTSLRTFNSQLLLERCENAWAADVPMYLVYRDTIGIQQSTQIMAARAIKTDEGEIIQLWVRNGYDAKKSDIPAIPPYRDDNE
jgi:hypothetical protein